MRRTEPLVRPGREPDPVEDLLVGFFSLLGWMFGGLVSVLVRHPLLTLALVAAVVVERAGDGPALLALAVSTVLALAGWRLLQPESFAWMVAVPARSRWRGWWVYGRRWHRLMHAHGLVVTRRPDREEDPAVPALGRCRAGRWSDSLVVGLVAGQGPEDFDRAADRLAHAVGARSCRVEVIRPGVVRLVFVHGDPLAVPLPALPVPASAEAVDLVGVPVGRREDGQPWVLPVFGAHLLVAGAMGAGKGSVIWSLIRGLAPAIRSGLVAVWAIDPKGGMELGIGRPLFARYAAGTVAEMADLLEQAVAVMDARSARLAGVVRTHSPTADDPLLVVFVDELASLTAYVEDRDVKRRVATALALLLSKGRAVGVVVVAALQDPRKEVLPFRDLFPVRVALRLSEREAADMTLGPHAWERGARCDTIPRTAPGVGYVLVDGQREPVRVRAGYVTDDQVRGLAGAYPVPPSRLHCPVPAAPTEPAGDEEPSKPRRPPSRSRARAATAAAEAAGSAPAAGEAS